MSLEQKVGQLLMVGFGGKEIGSEVKKLLIGFHVGAVALYSRNIVNPTQVRGLIGNIFEVMQNEIPPFVTIDQEGGNVVRVHSKVAVLPGTMTLGATRDPVLAYLAGQAQAVDLKLVGFNMNMAPVLDTNHNPKNPVINVRAFGDHHNLVAQMGVAFVRGQQSGGLVTVAKHFPGHGATEQDSHFALPRITLSLQDLLETELKPFRLAIDSGLDAIMTAHVQVPAIDRDGTPASLSKRVIQGILREKLGFGGLVVTDDLEMRAITESRGIGEAAVQAILAGADMVMVIWTPRRKREVFQALIEASQKGRITQSRLQTSLRRILTLKAKHGLLWPKQIRVAKGTIDLLPNAYHQQVARTIAARGMTLVVNKRSLLPLCSGHNVLVASPLRHFRNEMSRLLPNAKVLPLKRISTHQNREAELAQLIAMAKKNRLVVVGAQNLYQAWLVQNLMEKVSTPVVVVSFGSPYLYRYFPKVSGYVCTYSYIPTAQMAAAQSLVGRMSITGRLPINLSHKYGRGHGLTLPRNICSSRTASRQTKEALPPL